MDKTSDEFILLEDKVYNLMSALLFCNTKFMIWDKKFVKIEVQFLISKSLSFETKYDRKLFILGLLKVFE